MTHRPTTAELAIAAGLMEGVEGELKRLREGLTADTAAETAQKLGKELTPLMQAVYGLKGMQGEVHAPEAHYAKPHPGGGGNSVAPIPDDAPSA